MINLERRSAHGEKARQEKRKKIIFFLFEDLQTGPLPDGRGFSW
jgi:hypothetical protein